MFLSWCRLIVYYYFSVVDFQNLKIFCCFLQIFLNFKIFSFAWCFELFSSYYSLKKIRFLPCASRVTDLPELFLFLLLFFFFARLFVFRAYFHIFCTVLDAVLVFGWFDTFSKIFVVLLVVVLANSCIFRESYYNKFQTAIKLVLIIRFFSDFHGRTIL